MARGPMQLHRLHRLKAGPAHENTATDRVIQCFAKFENKAEVMCMTSTV